MYFYIAKSYENKYEQQKRSKVHFGQRIGEDGVSFAHVDSPGYASVNYTTRLVTLLLSITKCFM